MYNFNFISCSPLVFSKKFARFCVIPRYTNSLLYSDSSIPSNQNDDRTQLCCLVGMTFNQPEVASFSHDKRVVFQVKVFQHNECSWSVNLDYTFLVNKMRCFLLCHQRFMSVPGIFKNLQMNIWNCENFICQNFLREESVTVNIS